MACRAEARTGLGKADRRGSEGGLETREPWWNEAPAVQPKGYRPETLHLPLRALHFYPDSRTLRLTWRGLETCPWWNCDPIPQAKERDWKPSTYSRRACPRPYLNVELRHEVVSVIVVLDTTS